MENNYITKPSIVRLARRAGVKSLSEDCYDEIFDLANIILTDIVNGDYTPENFKLDILDSIRENNRSDS